MMIGTHHTGRSPISQNLTTTDEVNLDWITQDLENTGTALTADVPAVLGEIALKEGNLEEALRQAEAALQRIHAFLIELETRTFPKGDHGRIDKMAHRADQDFIAGLSDDLNISTSLSALFGLIKQANVLLEQDSVSRSGAERLKETLRSWDRVLGVLPPQDERILPDDIVRKIQEREEARAAKNYDHADRIRDELLARGIVLEDTKEGVRWKRIREDSTGD